MLPAESPFAVFSVQDEHFKNLFSLLDRVSERNILAFNCMVVISIIIFWQIINIYFGDKIKRFYEYKNNILKHIYGNLTKLQK
jgi:hypothetical protein